MKMQFEAQKKRGENSQNIELKFIRYDGTPTQNAVYSNRDETGKLYFFEILGQSRIAEIPSVKILEKEKYRRIMIQKVYPVVPGSGNDPYETEIYNNEVQEDRQ